MTAGSAQKTLQHQDLFAPHLRRERVIDWQAPGPAAKAAMTMSGMEAMCAIRDGILPPPPAAVGKVGHNSGRGQADQAGPPDQLHRRLCARWRR